MRRRACPRSAHCSAAGRRPDMALLRTAQLTKRFDGLVANNSIDIEVPQGSLFAVIGPFGTGKTTFFSMVSGFLASSSGSIAFDGRDITRVPQHEIAAMGLVRTFQLVQLFKGMSVAENVEVGCHLATRGGVAASLFRPAWFRKQEREVRERATELLDFGRKIAEGTPDESKAHPEVIAAYLGVEEGANA